jgi:hypothetical protein
MADNGRNADGTFGVGNPGGPGRPRRSVEREYLAALSDAVSTADWRAICQRARDDALQGDAGARAFLAKYLLGAAPLRLLDLAADESGGFTAEAEIADQRGIRRDERFLRLVSLSLSADQPAEAGKRAPPGGSNR